MNQQRRQTLPWAALGTALPAGGGRRSWPSVWYQWGHAAVSSAGILSTRDMDIVERAQWRAMKMMQRLEHLSSEEGLKVIGLLRLLKRRLSGDHAHVSMYFNVHTTFSKLSSTIASCCLCTLKDPDFVYSAWPQFCGTWEKNNLQNCDSTWCVLKNWKSWWVYKEGGSECFWRGWSEQTRHITILYSSVVRTHL